MPAKIKITGSTESAIAPPTGPYPAVQVRQVIRTRWGRTLGRIMKLATKIENNKPTIASPPSFACFPDFFRWVREEASRGFNWSLVKGSRSLWMNTSWPRNTGPPESVRSYQHGRAPRCFCFPLQIWPSRSGTQTTKLQGRLGFAEVTNN
jgi:hypothetical protein